MSVIRNETSGEILIVPTPWKYWTLAGVFGVMGLLLVPVPDLGPVGFGLLAVSGFNALMATGKIMNVRIGRDGVTFRNMQRQKFYAWTNVSEFQGRSYTINYFYQLPQIVFSQLDKAGLMSKAAKFLGGGTEVYNIYGIKLRDAVTLLNVARDAAVSRAPHPQVSASPQPRMQAEPRPQSAPRPQAQPQPVIVSDRPSVMGNPMQGQPARFGKRSGSDPITGQRQSPLIS